MKISHRLCLLLLTLVPSVALAQPEKAAPPDNTNTELVEIKNADGGIAIDDGIQKLARITKDVVITQPGQNLVVYAQEVIYDKNRNRANASGQLCVVTREATIRGQNLCADFNSHQFTMFGDVVITAYGKNDGAMAGLRDGTDKKPVRVLCDQVVWEYDTRQATATGNIHIAQGTNRGTCDKIIYSEPENVVNLLGNVQFGDEQNRKFRAQDITVYVNNDIVNSDSRVVIDFIEKEGMQGDNSPPKARIPIKPLRTLPPDLPDNNIPVLPPPTTPRQTPTEELNITPSPPNLIG